MHNRPEKVFYVYIMASKPHGVLYVGMSSDLAGRAWKHREHVLEVRVVRRPAVLMHALRPGANAP